LPTASAAALAIGQWRPFVEEATAKIRAQVDRYGSSAALAAALIQPSRGYPAPRHWRPADVHFRGQRVLRLDEAAQIRHRFESLALPYIRRCGESVCRSLNGCHRSGRSERSSGATFIDVFEAEATKLGHVDFLAQGTLYPDVIDSVSIVGSRRSSRASQCRRVA